MSAIVDNDHPRNDPIVDARQREFGSYRSIEIEGSLAVRDPSDTPRYLVLSDNDEYERLRVQRCMFFIELETVALPRRDSLKDRLIAALGEARTSFANVVEAIHLGDDAIILNIITTCGQRSTLNELNRGIAEAISRFHAQKSNMIVYYSDELGFQDRLNR